MDLSSESALVRMSRDGNSVVVGGFGSNYIGAEYFAVASDDIPTITDDLTEYASKNTVWKSRISGGRGKRIRHCLAHRTHRRRPGKSQCDFRPPGALERDRFGQSVAIDASGQNHCRRRPNARRPTTG